MVHTGHRERLRQRYRREGLDSFELHNVLELVLFHVIPRKDTNEIAHRLVEKYHSLSAILEAPEEELCKIEGIGNTAACFLHMIPSLCRLYMTDLRWPENNCISSTEQACEFLAARLSGYDHEVVAVLLLTAKGRIQCCDIIADGSINSADMDLRKLVSMCLTYKSSRVIVAHNHPSGMAMPSREDMQTTQAIAEALRTCGTQLIDHVIVADGDYISLADSGFMGDIQ